MGQLHLAATDVVASLAGPIASSFRVDAKNTSTLSVTVLTPGADYTSASGTVFLPPEEHDLAITTLVVPKTVILTASEPSKAAAVTVKIQNRASHDETIQSLDMIEKLVKLDIESLGICPAPIPVLLDDPIQKKLPFTLRPNKKLNVTFAVQFDCANDADKNTKKNSGHLDYRHTASVDHSALDNIADTQPEDDFCPRDPYEAMRPDGTTKTDKGCGAKKIDGTLGADVVTDVVVQ